MLFLFRFGLSQPAFSVGNYCVQLRIGNAALIYVSGIIRDFRKSHPDFDLDCPQGCDSGAMVSRCRLFPPPPPLCVCGDRMIRYFVLT